MRDMRRVDSYPETNKRRGISPWFRVGLLGTYHRGILLGLGWHNLVNDPALGGWRYHDWRQKDSEEPLGQKVVLIGKVPFESIEEVEWDGDEYYNYPHIYCYFKHEKQPL